MSADPKWRVVTVPVGPEDAHSKRECLHEDDTQAGAVSFYEHLRQSGVQGPGVLVLDPDDTVIYATVIYARQMTRKR